MFPAFQVADDKSELGPTSSLDLGLCTFLRPSASVGLRLEEQLHLRWRDVDLLVGVNIEKAHVIRGLAGEKALVVKR